MGVSKVGQAYAGHTLLHVGERSPKDKNYETSEVVLAAPGTVVAPIPKGMDASPENALALIISQLLKTAGPAGLAPKGRGPRVPKKMAGGGITGSQLTPDQYGQLMDALAGRTAGQYNANRNYYANQNAGADASKLGWARLAMEGRSSDPRGGENPSVQRGIDQNRFDANLASTNKQNAADNSWRYAQMASQERMASQANATNREQNANQLENWRTNSGLQNAQNQFDQLLRGVSESALPGLRYGRAPSGGVGF